MKPQLLSTATATLQQTTKPPFRIFLILNHLGNQNTRIQGSLTSVLFLFFTKPLPLLFTDGGFVNLRVTFCSPADLLSQLMFFINTFFNLSHFMKSVSSTTVPIGRHYSCSIIHASDWFEYSFKRSKWTNFSDISGSSVKIRSSTAGKAASILFSRYGSSSSSARGNGHPEDTTAAVINPCKAFQRATAPLDGRIKTREHLYAALLATLEVGEPITHVGSF
jgi:hypothetical protein